MCVCVRASVCVCVCVCACVVSHSALSQRKTQVMGGTCDSVGVGGCWLGGCYGACGGSGACGDGSVLWCVWLMAACYGACVLEMDGCCGACGGWQGVMVRVGVAGCYGACVMEMDGCYGACGACGDGRALWCV